MVLVRRVMTLPLQKSPYRMETVSSLVSGSPLPNEFRTNDESPSPAESVQLSPIVSVQRDAAAYGSPSSSWSTRSSPATSSTS